MAKNRFRLELEESGVCICIKGHTTTGEESKIIREGKKYYYTYPSTKLNRNFAVSISTKITNHPNDMVYFYTEDGFIEFFRTIEHNRELLIDKILE